MGGYTWTMPPTYHLLREPETTIELTLMTPIGGRAAVAMLFVAALAFTALWALRRRSVDYQELRGQESCAFLCQVKSYTLPEN